MEGPRFLRDGDFKSLSKLLDICFGSKKAGEVANEWPHVCRPEKEYYDRYLVYSDAGRIVSSVAVVPMPLYIEGGILPVGGISIVGTHPSYRLQGLAGGLVRASIELMKKREYAIAWLNGSRQLYDRYGWERAGRKYNFHFNRRSTAGFSPVTTDIRRFAGEDPILNAVKRMYEKRELRGVRDKDLTRLLLTRGRNETYVSLANGRVKGYLTVQVSRNKPKNAEVNEYGGSDRAFRDLMRYCFDTIGLEYVSMASPVIPDRCRSAMLDGASAWDMGFSGWIESGGMVKILDLAAILKAFIPQMERKRRETATTTTDTITLKLRETNEIVGLTFGKGVKLSANQTEAALSMGERDLVRLLFGLDADQHPKSPGLPLSSVLPLDFYVSPLEMV